MVVTFGPNIQAKDAVVIGRHLNIPFGAFWELQCEVEEVHLHRHWNHLNLPAPLSPQLQSFAGHHSQSSQELYSLLLCVDANINIKLNL